MTRLTKNDLSGLEQMLKRYDIGLANRTGLSLRAIACAAAGIQEDRFLQAAGSNSVYVVPVTAGEGIISGFAQSVGSIIEYLGFPANVSCGQDVSGFAEAVDGGASIVFMADDQKFIAANLATGCVIDNAAATARGYVAALNAMGKGLKGCDVLVIGAGRVGTVAIAFLKQLGANISLFELNPKRLQRWKHTGINIEKNLFKVLPQFKYIIDASPEPEFIDLAHLHPDAAIAAPGIPLGLTGEAYRVFKERVIHDPLQIGVAAMLSMAVR